MNLPRKRHLRRIVETGVFFTPNGFSPPLSNQTPLTNTPPLTHPNLTHPNVHLLKFLSDSDHYLHQHTQIESHPHISNNRPFFNNTQQHFHFLVKPADEANAKAPHKNCFR